MKRNPFDAVDRQYLLLKIQYLGFRFHGWQKQPNNLPTVERILTRTLRFILGDINFKVLAAGRTDAKVSVNQSWVELFIESSSALVIEDLLNDINQNLPSDVRALDLVPTTADFNIIQSPKVKEYIYLFSYGEKNHPFAAPLMVYIKEELDIPLMKAAAQMFKGTHDFWSYTYKPKDDTQTLATIRECTIEMNTLYSANFFPSVSYLLRVKGAGFKRHQIRLMMGALIDVGRGTMSMDHFKSSLVGQNRIHLSHIAPASGLILQSVGFIAEEE